MPRWNVSAALVGHHEGLLCIRVGCKEAEAPTRMKAFGRKKGNRFHEAVDYKVIAKTDGRLKVGLIENALTTVNSTQLVEPRLKRRTQSRVSDASAEATSPA